MTAASWEEEIYENTWGFVHKYSVNDRVGRDSGAQGTVTECLSNCEVYKVVFDRMWESTPVLVTGSELYFI